MSIMKVVVATVVGLAITMMIMVQPGQATIDCQQLRSVLTPCLPYLTGRTNAPSADCCGGVNTLKSSTLTTADRRAACVCLKAAASHFPDIKEDLGVLLPKRCGIAVLVPISKDIKCSDINNI